VGFLEYENRCCDMALYSFPWAFCLPFLGSPMLSPEIIGDYKWISYTHTGPQHPLYWVGVRTHPYTWSMTEVSVTDIIYIQ